MDARMRALQRQAATGDPQAEAALGRERNRMGQCVRCDVRPAGPFMSREGVMFCAACSSLIDLERMHNSTLKWDGYVDHDGRHVASSTGAPVAAIVGRPGRAGFGAHSWHWSGVDRWGRGWHGWNLGPSMVTGMWLDKSDRVRGSDFQREHASPSEFPTRYERLRREQREWFTEHGFDPDEPLPNPPARDDRRYRFVTSCVNSTMEDIHALQDSGRGIARATFVRKLAPGEWKEIQQQLGYDRDFSITRDWHVGYYRGVYRGVPAVWLEHSRIEHIFTLDGKQGPSATHAPPRQNTGMDERMRDLERLAAQGDLQAAARLAAARLRARQPDLTGMRVVLQTPVGLVSMPASYDATTITAEDVEHDPALVSIDESEMTAANEAVQGAVEMFEGADWTHELLRGGRVTTAIDEEPRYCHGSARGCDVCEAGRAAAELCAREGRSALHALFRGNVTLALQHAEEAQRAENEFGDSPAWRPAVEAIRRLVP